MNAWMDAQQGSGDGARVGAPQDEPPVLRVSGLHVAFDTGAGRVQVVEDISFTIAAGRTVALVGESGSGKSVTSLAVMRLQRGEDLVQFAHHHKVEIMQGEANPVVGDPVLRKIVGADTLVAIAGADEVAPHFRALGMGFLAL